MDVKKLRAKTTLGKISYYLILFALACFIFMNIMVATGETGGNKLSDNLKLAIPGVLGAICAIGAFFTGLTAIVKDKERCIVVYISTFLGGLILIFLLGELVVEH